MAYRFEIAPRAIADADAVYNRIARDSPARAANWYRGLFARIETLRSHPRRCVVALETQTFGEEIRHLLYGRRGGVYRILFTVRGEVITVFAIRHGAQQPLTPDELDEEDGGEE